MTTGPPTLDLCSRCRYLAITLATRFQQKTLFPESLGPPSWSRSFALRKVFWLPKRPSWSAGAGQVEVLERFGPPKYTLGQPLGIQNEVLDGNWISKLTSRHAVGTQVGHKKVLRASKLAPRALKMSPSWPQERPSSAQEAPKTLQVGWL